MAKLVAYIRVSTDGQTDGFGPDVQKEQIAVWAKTNGHKVVHTCEDAISGTVDISERPGFACVIAHLEDGADGVVMMSLDRLGRSVVVTESALAVVWRLGKAVFTADSGEVASDDGDETQVLLRQIMAAVAQFERTRITKRMRLGRKMKGERGGFAYGSPAFGTCSDGEGELTTDTGEAETVELILSMAGAGESARAICRHLNDNNIPSKRGGAWHPQTVTRVLNRNK